MGNCRRWEICSPHDRSWFKLGASQRSSSDMGSLLSTRKIGCQILKQTKLHKTASLTSGWDLLVLQHAVAPRAGKLALDLYEPSRWLSVQTSFAQAYESPSAKCVLRVATYIATIFQQFHCCLAA